MTSRAVRSLLLSCSLVLALTPLAGAPQTPSMPGYPAVGGAAAVTLASPGAEPRARLRLRIAPDYKNAMTITTTMAVTMNMAGMAMPAMQLPVMKMTASLAVTNVAANGDVTYSMAFTGMTAEALPGMDPSIVSMIQAAASEITNLKGTVTVSDRGVNRSGAVDLDKVNDPTLRQTLSGMMSSVESMSMPLPEEAVGVGARWEVRQALQSNGMHIFQRVECELASVDGPAITIRVKVEQTAPPQAINNPSLPAGATMEIEKVTGSGSGTITLRLDSLVPTSEISSTNSASMIANLGGQQQRMAADTTLKVTIAPVK